MEIKEQLDALDKNIDGIKTSVETLEEKSVANASAISELSVALKNVGSNLQPKETKSFNQVLTENIKETFDAIKTLKKGQTVGFDMKAVGDMTFANNFSTADTTVAQVRPGIVALPNRKVHIRSLLPIGTLGKSTFDFVRETGGEGNIATVTEGASKPQFDIDFEEASAPAQYIAGWVRISTKMLDDVDSLSSFLNMRLLEKYLNVEDAQLLNGPGTGSNLLGLITAATAASGSATVDVEQIMDAITQLESSEYTANGVLLHPTDYNNIAKTKAAGSGEYDLPGIVQMLNGQLFIYGVPVYKSTAIAADTFLVGDWAMGAQILSREAPRVEFFNQDGTNVRENKITVRVEGRIAFPIYYAGAFVKGDFNNIA